MRRYTLTWILVGLVCATALVGLQLIVHNGDLLYFANVSPRYLTGDTSVVWVGYDGQFAYFIAKDPLGSLSHLDAPVYRFQRILYPMLARVLALGQADWVPFTLILVNLLAVAFGTGAFANLLYRERAPAWIPILFPLWFGVGQTLLWDLYELTALTLALWALVLFVEKRTLSAGSLWGLAALGKELAFLLSVPAVVQLILKRQWRNATQLAALSFGPYFVWMIVLRLTMGSWNVEAASITPLSGVNPDDASIPFVLALVILPAALISLSMLRNRVDLYELATLASTAFMILLVIHTYGGQVVFRLSTPLVLSSVLVLARFQHRTSVSVCAAAWSATVALTILLAFRG